MAFATWIFFVPFLARLADAQNDWTTPCFNGTCQYSLPSSSGSSSGTLKIWGPPGTISDITPAAGWQILNCSQNALSQDIRLVCNSSDTASVGCDHLFDNDGPEGKLVRLPESCGKSAFARVAKSWIPDDQSIPSTIAARIVHRNAQPQVKALRLDTNFSAIDVSKAGVVNLAIVGANVPGVDPRFVDTATTLTTRSSRIYGRGLTDFIGNAIDSIKNLNNFNISKTQALPPIDADKKINLFNTTLSCPPISATVSVDAEGKAHAVVTLGVAALGTIAPPQVQQFSIITGLTADLNGTIDLNADATGTLDSGKIKLFEVGIPGLDFPGVLSIGPSFIINAEAKATLDLDVDMKVGLNYHISNAQLIFPPNGQKSGGTFNIGDTPLTLSASPSVQATGSVEAHIIPTLNLGIDALDGVAGANIFLDLDTSATMELTLGASADASATVQKARRAKSVNSTASTMHLKSAATTSHKAMSTSSSVSKTTTKKGTMGSTSVAANSTKMMGSTSTTSASASTKTSSISTSADTSFGGCFDIKAGLSVNAGADADFFGLFNAATQVPLFSKTFQLFRKCFGTPPTRRSIGLLGVSRIQRSATAQQLERRVDFSCLSTNSTTPVSIENATLKAASIKSI